MDVMINEKDLKQKRDQLKEELRNKKSELKDKQNLMRKQEKQMKDQHEAIIKLEEKTKKIQAIINEKKAGIVSTEEEKTDEDIKKMEEEIKELEKLQSDEKKKYRQMITVQETKINELTQQIDALNLELKQKDQECRLNVLKINELKRQLRLGSVKPGPAESSGISSKLPESQSRDSKISKDVEQAKKDMQAEDAKQNEEIKAKTGVEASHPAANQPKYLTPQTNES